MNFLRGLPEIARVHARMLLATFRCRGVLAFFEAAVQAIESASKPLTGLLIRGICRDCAITGADVTMSVFRAIYTSRPFGFDSSILSGILMDAQRANARDGITGALICRADIYLQWLEGPEEQVRKAIDRIKRDDRHVEVKVHVAETVPERLFGEWDMLHDPAATWIWSQAEVTGGAVERAGADEVTGFFLRLREKY